MTGGSGYLGREMMTFFSSKGLEIYNLDLTKGESVMDGNQDLVEDCDAVVHLAAISDVNEAVKNPGETIRINVMGTLNMLEQVRNSKGCNTLIFASSEWVYNGLETEEIITENTDLPDPKHIYSASKIAAEAICKSYREYGVNVIILRYGGVYGGKMRKGTMFHNFIDKINNMEDITVFGDGLAFRKFCHIQDIAYATYLCLLKGAKNKTYNVLGEKSITVNDIAKLIIDAFWEEFDKNYSELEESMARLDLRTIKIHHTECREGDFKGLNISSEKIRRELGWKQEVDFKESIKEMIKKFGCRF